MATKNNPGTYDCYSRAEPDEPMFVLLGRDPTAAAMVVAWACIHALRKPDELEKAKEALICARDMFRWCKKVGKEPMSFRELEALADKVDALISEEKVAGVLGVELIEELVQMFHRKEKSK